MLCDVSVEMKCDLIFDITVAIGFIIYDVKVLVCCIIYDAMVAMWYTMCDV